MKLSKSRQAAVTAAMPASLRATVAPYEWVRDDTGQSGAAVYRLQGRDGAPDLYLKHGRGCAAADIADELARLRWLAQYLPVPAVVEFARVADPDQAWLLMMAIPGTTASAVLEENPALGPAVTDALAAFLRRLHALPVNACPFDAGPAVRLAQARQRIDAGLVDAEDFDAGREDWTAEQVWLALQERVPLAPDLVVTHGDFSLENILMHEGAVVGCLDVGRAGVADRYQDLAIAWRGLGELDTSLQQRLLRQYGILDADQGKLQFHWLLDELF
ncbi:APH(3') family aminoglycoside O-phosphotransferase [Janthinobacterium sp. EB271-G4-7A]|uniref:APH(3') family aminoglycoside O-phosphotransferase n=1 Tax=Janthinobacterium sp. EB271-G4-7A TaxID=2775056 RepID=UPI001E43CE32|nr:APH(3') family aminoglycoside O-phosphotransferase [Janthinobacterium sp. EB271-G4-7A]MCC7696383.1 aminoglycoside 3'-phosphotransferase [Janthinobacterium sp. EB271-G4-7A]